MKSFKRGSVSRVCSFVWGHLDSPGPTEIALPSAFPGLKHPIGLWSLYRFNKRKWTDRRIPKKQLVEKLANKILLLFLLLLPPPPPILLLLAIHSSFHNEEVEEGDTQTSTAVLLQYSPRRKGQNYRGRPCSLPILMGWWIKFAGRKKWPLLPTLLFWKQGNPESTCWHDLKSV